MKKLLIAAVLGTVLAIAACGPGAEPTPTPTSTPVVVATATPTPGIVATATPTAKPLATPTATPRPVVATPTPTAAPLATATATATPKRGGIVKVRLAATPPTFYAHQTTSSGKEGMMPVYNSLIGQDPLDPTSEKIVPELADRWEISGDGLTYTFYLHQGVKWHDGVPFTAADVKYNIDLVRDPPRGFVSPRKSDYDAVASIETPNDYTVVFKMKRVSNSLLGTLSTSIYVIMPKHLIEKDVLNSMKLVMVGTGPYLFKSLTPESIIVHERNPNYFKPGLPYLDGMRFITIADTQAFIAALYTGQIDTASSSSAIRQAIGKTERARILKERPELLVQGAATGLSFTHLMLNTKVPPFTDQRVRQAMAEAIDKVQMLNTSGSMGQVGAMVKPGSFWDLPVEELAKLPGFGPDISARRARARQLLKDAGIADGTEITLAANVGNPLRAELAELTQLQLLEALPSLKVNVRGYSSAEFGAVEAASSFQAGFEAQGYKLTDPDFVGQLITTGGGQNYTGISDPRIDELQVKQSIILDPAQRRLVVWERDKLVIQNSAVVPLFWRSDVCPAWPYVKNQVCTAANNGERYELVWLDK